MHVIPTILTTSTEEFITQMKVFQPYYNRIQLDIADGILVPNKTTQIEEMISLLSNQEVTFNPQVEFDFHLMVTDFTNELIKIKKMSELGMKINTILINAELNPNIAELASQYKFTIGLDISPKTDLHSVEIQYKLNTLPALQIMTVEPGFQGSPFLDRMLLKIEQLRQLDYKGIIMIDGGVSNVTIPIIKSKKYIPDFVCVGSYLTKAGDSLEERVNLLNSL